MTVKMVTLAAGLATGALIPTVIVGTMFSHADVSKELVGTFLSLMGLIIVIVTYRTNSSWRITLHGSLGAGFIISAFIYYISTLAIM